jgi:RNA recognition motif-containing protein
MEDIELPKVFVGNVPFLCDNNEFKECFKNIAGFVDAEIVNRHNSEYSRGFGFVTLKTIDDATKLLSRNDIILKDRTLRFTSYNLNDKNKNNQKINKNYLFIKNVPKDIKKDNIVNFFKEYGDVGICFMSSNPKTNGLTNNIIIEIKNDDIYELLLNLKTVQFSDEIFLNINKWRNKQKSYSDFTKISNSNSNSNNINNNNNSNIYAKEIYRIAFNAGINVGRLEGIHIAKSKSENNYFEKFGNIESSDNLDFLSDLNSSDSFDGLGGFDGFDGLDITKMYNDVDNINNKNIAIDQDNYNKSS